jgi:probable rRNA maturation factor
MGAITITRHRLEIFIAAKGWHTLPNLRRRLDAAARTSVAMLPKNLHFPCTLTLLLTTDAAVQRLNRDFRGIKTPTNVLAFPQWKRAELTKKGRSKEPIAMGDIIIGYQYMVDEAKKDHKLLINHVLHLLIHGILHLFGYTHDRVAEAIQMERLERKILSGLGLPDPYYEKSKAVKRRSRNPKCKR